MTSGGYAYGGWPTVDTPDGRGSPPSPHVIAQPAARGAAGKPGSPENILDRIDKTGRRIGLGPREHSADLVAVALRFAEGQETLDDIQLCRSIGEVYSGDWNRRALPFDPDFEVGRLIVYRAAAFRTLTKSCIGMPDLESIRSTLVDAHGEALNKFRQALYPKQITTPPEVGDAPPSLRPNRQAQPPPLPQPPRPWTRSRPEIDKNVAFMASFKLGGLKRTLGEDDFQAFGAKLRAFAVRHTAGATTDEDRTWLQQLDGVSMADDVGYRDEETRLLTGTALALGMARELGGEIAGIDDAYNGAIDAVASNMMSKGTVYGEPSAHRTSGDRPVGPPR